MANKKYLLLILVSIFIFLGWQGSVKAEACTYEREIYLGEKSQGKDDDMIFIEVQSNGNNYTYKWGPNYGDFAGNPSYFSPITLYMSDEKLYNDAVCPRHVFTLKKDTKTYYASNDDWPSDISKINIGYNYREYARTTNTNTCLYDTYFYDKGTKQFIKSTDTKSLGVQVKILYDQSVSGLNSKLFNIRYTFADSDHVFYMGSTKDYPIITSSVMTADTCPAYLVKTYTQGIFNTFSYYVDAFDTDQKSVAEKRAQTDNALKYNNTTPYYYEKSVTQPEQPEKKITATTSCAYFRGTNINSLDKILVNISRGTITNPTTTSPSTETIYYELTVKRIIGNSAEGSAALPVDANAFKSELLESILANADSNNACVSYPYIDMTTDLTSVSRDVEVQFQFLEKLTNELYAFKYYKLAKTNEQANEYKEKLQYADDLLFGSNGLINEIKKYNNSSSYNQAIINMFLDAAKNEEKPAPQEVMNVASYLASGGKANKAIYDYANYWYALATNYASYLIIDEQPAGELNQMAEDFKSKIAENVKAGYIPIPDGCDMLSQDLVDFLAWGLRIIRYGAVAITIILGMIDFFRAIAESDDKAFQKAGGRFLKRIIAVVLIFLAALFVQFILYNYALPGIGEEEINLCNITKSS